jgi:site-specific DNA recombinase
MDRPGLRRLRDLVNTKAITAVVVHDPDRLSRNLGHQLLLAEEFERAAVKLLIVSHPIEQGPEGWLFFQMRGALAEYERAKLMERTHRGRVGRAQAGNLWGGQVPLGYRAVREPHQARWEIDEEEAALVRRIFQMSLGGLTMHAIAKQLSLEGIPTHYDRHPHGGGRKIFRPALWDLSSIYKILTDEAYTGRAYWGKSKRISKTQRVLRPREEWIAIPVPAIIEEELFQAVQRQLANNKAWSRRNRKYDYLLTGRYFRCGRCGRAMTGCAPDGVRYYRCNSLCTVPDPAQRCRGHVRADEVESQVWNAVMRRLEEPDLIAAEVTRQQAGADEQREAIQREIAIIESALLKCKKEMQRWADAYAAEVISLEELKVYRADIAARRQSLLAEQAERQASLEAIGEAMHHVEALVGYCVRVRESLHTFDAEEKQRAFEALTLRVTWTPGEPPKITGSIPLELIDFIPSARGPDTRNPDRW